MLQIGLNYYGVFRRSKWNDVLVILVSLLTLTKGVIIKSPPIMVKQPPSDEEMLFQIATGPEEKYQSLKIECEAEGDPAPRYEWYKNGEPFYGGYYISWQSGGTFVITSPEEKYLGQYQCFAENELGIATSNSVFIRKSELNNFKNEDPTTVTINEGQPASLQCQPPDGYPKPTVNWMLQDDRGAFHLINSTRKTVDPEGTLWFSNVTREDEFNDSIYTCVATSTFRNELKLGSKVALKVLEMDSTVNQVNVEPKQQFLSRNNTIILKGKTLRLWCIFSGTPLPQIKWTKKNGVLPNDRVDYENYGRTLIIKDLDFDDEGTYECEATNGVGKAKSYIMNVEVQAVPYFTVEPEIQIKDEGETAIFRCEAKGNPEPEIRWIFNGEHIEKVSSKANREILPSMIRIFNLSRVDIGNYGCNATNDHGYVYKDVYINVLAHPPEINKSSSYYVQTVDGQTVSIKCIVYGAPKPSITWSKDGHELPAGGRYNVEEDGDLIIQEVTFTDMGEYSCKAVNKFGESHDYTYIKVWKRAKIINSPLDYEVNDGATAIFRCNFEIDPNLYYNIDWMINGKTIDFEQEPRFVKQSDRSWRGWVIDGKRMDYRQGLRFLEESDSSFDYKAMDELDRRLVENIYNTLRITKTTKLDSGSVTCIASSNFDEIKKSASLIVSDIPNPPKLLTIECHDKDANITWQPMGDNGFPILGYTIQQNTSFRPDTWDDVLTDLPASSTEVNMFMSPWNNYTFRVIARNKIGASLPSGHSEVCTTPEDVPYKNPDNVKGKGCLTNLIIMWSPIPEMEHNGPGFKYRVYWKRDDIKDAGWSTDEVVDCKQNHYVVENQPTYKPYRIKVEAHNDVGKARIPVWEVIGWSGEDVPLESPENLTLIEIKSSTTARLSWLSVSNESIRGQFKGYAIETWTESEDQRDSRNIILEDLEDNEPSAIINSFVPYTKNYVRVLVFNGAHDGPPSDTIELDMPEGVPGPVDSLEAIPVGSSGFLLVWQKPKRPNGVLLGYRIFYQKVQDTEHGPVVQRFPPITDPERTRVKLVELQPGTRYRLSLKAETRAGTGPEYFIEGVTKAAGNSTPPGKPKFTWQQIQTRTGHPALKITWLPNESNAGASFFVQYKRYGEFMFVDSKMETADDYLMIHDLEPEERYEIRVVSVDDEYKIASDVEVIETQPYGIRARSHYKESQNGLVNKLMKQLKEVIQSLWSLAS